MKIQVTGRHVEVTEDLREYIETKANKLPRYYDRIHEIEVVLDHESEQFTAEMIVRVDQKHTFVLVDLVVDKLERQLVRHKEKRRNHKHDGKADFPSQA